MIRGLVRSGREALVPITIHGARPAKIRAVVDTGFTGHLCLAADLRRRMTLRRSGDVELELADGRRVQQAAYVGEVTFDRRRRTVLVTLTRSLDSLVGTSLLMGKHLRVEWIAGGRVVIADVKTESR